MKVLMVAPRICTPWSEGRKKFFRDLCQETIDRWNLVALITIDDGERSDLPVATEEYVSKHAWQHLTHIRFKLRDAITKHQPDMVCHLPFGVFSGVRGLANIWSILSVERLCKRLDVACCTLMYSLTSDANTRFHRYALRHAYLNQHGVAARSVRFGVSLPEVDQSLTIRAPKHENNILFMAGMAEETQERLDYALDTRGLRFLLKAGQRLQAEGFRLIVAIPLLRNKRLADKLRSDSDNQWEPDSIEYFGDLVSAKIYQRTHVFAFPYANEELQFVPTSIVEAMHYSVPVILPKLNFLTQFYEPGGRALAYTNGDVDSFVEQLKVIDDVVRLETLCAAAKAYVDSEYDIRNSVTDIEEIYRASSGN